MILYVFNISYTQFHRIHTLLTLSTASGLAVLYRETSTITSMQPSHYRSSFSWVLDGTSRTLDKHDNFSISNADEQVFVIIILKHHWGPLSVCTLLEVDP